MEEKKKSKEIDLIGLALQVLKEWKLLLRFMGVFAVLGVIIALNTPKQYTSETILAPEMSSGGLGLSSNLADMASNFGIDLGKKTSMDAIYPEIYPDVFGSTDFVLSLFSVPVRLKDDATQRTYLDHLLKDTKMPFWSYPKMWLISLIKKPEGTPGKGKSVKDPYRLSKVDAELCENISKSFTCLIDKKTSEISISFTDQDPMVAAIMADTMQRRLQSYITEYRTKKARVDVDYYKKMTTESKARYDAAQKEYAAYVDSNTDMILESYRAKRDELENNMQMQYNIYSKMNAMLENAQAKVQENTPAFTILKNAYMPVKASSRSRAATVLLYIFLGVIVGSIWILSRKKK